MSGTIYAPLTIQDSIVFAFLWRVSQSHVPILPPVSQTTSSITCISSCLLRSRCQDGIRHVGDLLGEGAGGGGERLQATRRSDIYGIWERKKVDGKQESNFVLWCDFKKGSSRLMSPQTTPRIRESPHLGRAPLPCSGIAWEWPVGNVHLVWK